MESLDNWRKLFSCADADIFEVIRHAILVARADRPDEFLARRDRITEMLYSCLPAEPIGIGTPDEGAVEDYMTPKESKNGVSSEEGSDLEEFRALTDEIEEQQAAVGEVLRIRDLLINWKEESEKALSESLRRLQLMGVSVEMLSATNIGRAVSGLNKHKSKPIRELARTLIKEWKLMVDEWMNAATTTQEASPASVNPSPAEDESLLPSELDFPPLDVGALLATETAPFEFSKFFDGMDEDGNPTSTKELRKPRQKETNLARKDDGDLKRQEVVPRVQKPMDSTRKDSKPPRNPSFSASESRKRSSEGTSDDTQKQNRSGEVREQAVAGPRETKPLGPTPKAASRPREDGVPSTPPLIPAAAPKPRQKSTGTPTKPCPRRDVSSKESEESSYQRKLEAAKRKLQDRYEEAKNAKKQRTIQVMELKDLPKQRQDAQQHIKGRHGNFFKRSGNAKLR